jgi:DNA-binding transcriptional LysR family regulator
MLEEVAEMERGLTMQTGVASSRLHVSAPSLLGRLRLAPMLPGFLAEQARVSIDLMLVDRPVRLADEGIDVALRIGPLEDSGLIASSTTSSLLSAPRRTICAGAVSRGPGSSKYALPGCALSR